MEFVEVIIDYYKDGEPMRIYPMPTDAADFSIQETENGVVISYIRCNNVEMHLGMGSC